MRLFILMKTAELPRSMILNANVLSTNARWMISLYGFFFQLFHNATAGGISKTLKLAP